MADALPLVVALAGCKDQDGAIIRPEAADIEKAQAELKVIAKVLPPELNRDLWRTK